MIGLLLPILRAVPVWAWAIAAALAWGGIQHHRATSSTKAAAIAEQRAAVEAATAQAEAAAREREHQITTQATEAADAYRSNLTAARRAAAGARTELDRLRDAVGAAQACPAGPASSAAGRADGAAQLRIVVGECAAALSQMAEAADAGDARLKGLQDYVKAIGAASAPTTTPRKD